MLFPGLELKHWKEMVENPRRPIVHWHVLKVGKRIQFISSVYFGFYNENKNLSN